MIKYLQLDFYCTWHRSWEISYGKNWPRKKKKEREGDGERLVSFFPQFSINISLVYKNHCTFGLF